MLWINALLGISVWCRYKGHTTENFGTITAVPCILEDPEIGLRNGDSVVITGWEMDRVGT